MQQDADFITADILYMFRASRWILTPPYGGVKIHLQP